jgi:hypothetical protein
MALYLNPEPGTQNKELFQSNHLQANGRWYFGLFTNLRKLPGLLIHPENKNVVGILIGNK